MKQIDEFISRLTNEAETGIESVVFSPNPFTDGQLLIVVAEKGVFVPDLVATAYRCDPPELPMHWLRPSELGQLAIPFGLAVFLSGRSGGYQGLSYWFKYEGRVLFGRDVLPEIPLPEKPVVLLQKHLLVCVTWLRNHCILENLANRSFDSLITALDDNARRLSASALLIKGVWKVDRGTVLGELGSAFANSELEEVTNVLEEVFAIPPNGNGKAESEAEMEERAYTASWGFERLMGLLRRYAE
jgi:hypothetical protein